MDLKKLFTLANPSPEIGAAKLAIFLQTTWLLPFFFSQERKLLFAILKSQVGFNGIDLGLRFSYSLIVVSGSGHFALHLDVELYLGLSA